MRLQQLFEDINSDNNKLSNAKKAFDDYMFEVKGHIELTGLDEFEAFEKTYQEMIAKLKTFNIKVKYKDETLKVNLVPTNNFSENKLGSLRTTTIDDGHTTQYIYQLDIYVNQKDDEELISINDFYHMFVKNYKKVFIHEFVHFIDAIDSDNRDRYHDTKRKLKQKGHYINTPQEYNAFYIQMMSEIDDAFEDSTVVGMFKKQPTFDRFLSLVNIETHAGEMLKDLEGKYKKAFKKRLFQLYNSFYDKFVEQDQES